MPRVTVKGQVTIPKNIRTMFNIKPGDVVEFRVENGRVFLEHKKGNILKAIVKPKGK